MGCGRKFTEGGQDRGFTIFAKLAPLFAQHYSISKAMRETGHSFYVVRKYFRKMQAIRGGAMSMPKRAGLRTQDTGIANPVSIVNEAKPLQNGLFCL
jgi:hypothetical protein